MPTKINMADYEEATDSYTGWCKRCKKFNTSCVEPDAEGYECEECGENTVCGAEQALLLGLIDIESAAGTINVRHGIGRIDDKRFEDE